MGTGYNMGTETFVFNEGVYFLVGGLLIFLLIILLISIVSMWKIFIKAGKQGWESIIPIYNIIVLFQITKTPMWLIILTLIPIINFIGAPVVTIILAINLAKAFGKDPAFSILLILLPIIGYPILAFDESQYIY